MANLPKKKVFYQIDEVCERLGLSLRDMAVLVSEGRIQLCATVGRLLVEDGHYEVALDDSACRLIDYYNHQRYHESLRNLTPAEVAPNRWTV